MLSPNLLESLFHFMRVWSSLLMRVFILLSMGKIIKILSRLDGCRIFACLTTTTHTVKDSTGKDALSSNYVRIKVNVAILELCLSQKQFSCFTCEIYVDYLNFDLDVLILYTYRMAYYQ